MAAEATNARVAWFSIGSLVVCLVLAGWQLWYLKVGHEAHVHIRWSHAIDFTWHVA